MNHTEERLAKVQELYRRLVRVGCDLETLLRDWPDDGTDFRNAVDDVLEKTSQADCQLSTAIANGVYLIEAVRSECEGFRRAEAKQPKGRARKPRLAAS